ncbi:MAG: hypothetical protein HYU84_13460 [Chloroflexi bacterium]|nr:hypothetical protein [Chloroflexota bacterium]
MDNIDNYEKKSSGATTGIIVGIVVLLCCLCLLALGIGGYAYYTVAQSGSSGDFPVFVDPISPDEPPSQSESPEIKRPPVDSISGETVETLENTVVPANDPRELACRLDGKCGVPEVMAESAVLRSVGEKQNFWVHDLDSNKNNEVPATLRYITPHVYFWAQDGLDIDEDEMKALLASRLPDISPRLTPRIR